MEPNSIFDLSDLSDVPEQVKNQLNVTKRDQLETQLIELFRLAQCELNLDQITIGFYRQYGELKDRAKLTAKLYNMSRSGNPAIQSVAGKKGVYKLRDGFI